MRNLTLVLLAGFALQAQAQPPRPHRPGVSTPGLRIPIEKLKPDAVYTIGGAPDWMAIDDETWVSNGPQNSVARMDPKSTTFVSVPVGKEPCSGLAAGFGSLWVPNCGDSTITRIGLKDAKVQATFPLTIADAEGGVAVGAGSFWILTDTHGTLARIDPATNKVAAEITVAPGSVAPVFADGAIWISSPEKSVLTRVDPKTNTVTDTIPVGPARC